MAYEYDVFLSYTGDAGMREWVENHFYDALQKCLEAEFRDPPKIYNFRDQSAGTTWPAKVKSAHLRSRFLVAIWAPSYFRSRWCMAEWKSMCARAAQCGAPTEGFLYPIKYGDGVHFPQEATDQLQSDFSQWAVPFTVFKETKLYPDFYSAVRKIAQDLNSRLPQVPVWRPDFPTVEPEPMPEAIFRLPGL